MSADTIYLAVQHPDVHGKFGVVTLGPAQFDIVSVRPTELVTTYEVRPQPGALWRQLTRAWLNGEAA